MWSTELEQMLEAGKFVWFVDDSVKQCKNKMGRVAQIFKDNDGFVQSASVKLPHGEFNGRNWRQYSMMVFPKSKTGPAMLAPLLNISKSYQTARIIF